MTAVAKGVNAKCPAHRLPLEKPIAQDGQSTPPKKGKPHFPTGGAFDDIDAPEPKKHQG